MSDAGDRRMRDARKLPFLPGSALAQPAPFFSGYLLASAAAPKNLPSTIFAISRQ
jgi:hypothetical protein